MPGMSSGINVTDPQVVSAFLSALLHQGLIAVLIFATLVVAWTTVRQLGRSGTANAGQGKAASCEPEPAGRQVLRIGFGIIWLFDGILQAQPKMAVGLPSQVIAPTAASSPHWVQTVVNWAGTNWSYHPIQTGAAAVWIQVGIGIWLLAAERGWLSRAAGLVSVGWGAVVWVFGESFGGIFAPGLSWLSGAPGAVLIYMVAGGLIALPDRAWRSRTLGRLVLAGTGVFLIGMAVLQAWPGRGFWQGVSHGQPGSLAASTQSMAQMRQPAFFTTIVSAFTTFDEAHGFAVNLVAVVALGTIGLAFASLRPRLLRPALIAFSVLCLAVWVLIQDFGFLGGLGTDPNSMIPMILVAAGGYLALTRVPSPAAATAIEPVTPAEPTSDGGRLARWKNLVNPESLSRRLAATSLRTVLAVGAVWVIVLGAAPMAVAQANPNADPILAEAVGGAAAPLQTRAWSFRLTDQFGKTVSLASLRGKVILLGFFDPVCTTDCPQMGAEFREAGALLRSDASKVELVGIVLSPTYRSLPVMRAFDQEVGLSAVPNWLYLTGSVSQLRPIWRNYGMIAEDLPAGAMTLHNDYSFIIDQTGLIREEFNADPGPGTEATESSFAVLFANAAKLALK
jgi:cytochrome oxidase Cu insertion factor (SCO1/SenC/PrrC family)